MKKLCGLLILVFIALGLLLRSVKISAYPGFNFDEAWFTQSALGIVFQKNFWPFFGMNSHTTSLTHYWTALCYKIFGPSVLVYRLSYVFWSIVGLASFSLGVARFFGSRSALAFTLLAAVSSALVLNDRTGIEVTGFYFGILGLLFFFSSLKESKASNVLILTALLAGTYSHILFFAVPLAWLAAEIFLHGKASERSRRLGTLYFALMLPFFIQLFFTSKWFLKAIAITLLSGGILYAFCKNLDFTKILAGKKKWIYILGLIIALPPTFNFLVFSQGTWSEFIFSGHLAYPLLSYLTAPLYLGLLYFSFALPLSRARLLSQSSAEQLVLFAFFLNIFCGYMAVTLEPKSFELPMLMTLVVISTLFVPSISQSRLQATGLVVIVLSLFWAFSFKLNCLDAYANHSIRNDKERIFLLKGSSYDYLPNFDTLKNFNEMGCHFGTDLMSRDPRITAAFAGLQAIFDAERAPKSTDKNPCPYSGDQIGRQNWPRYEKGKIGEAVILWSDAYFYLRDGRD